MLPFFLFRFNIFLYLSKLCDIIVITEINGIYYERKRKNNL